MPPPATADLNALMASIQGHLVRLLNARHGMSEALSDYGLPAMSDLLIGSGNHIQQMSEAIRSTIERYEPRLRKVRVTCQRNPETAHRHVLTFRIEATVISGRQEHRVWYETALRGNGAFEVTG